MKTCGEIVSSRSQKSKHKFLNNGSLFFKQLVWHERVVATSRYKDMARDLELEWNEADNHVYMTGPATEVFSGVWTSTE